MTDPYDIVVVGAGPAGSTAARTAAQQGARVLLVDRRPRIGVPVQCGEFVPRWISRHAPFTSRSIIQVVESMITHLSDHDLFEMKSPGYMLDRSLFDKELVASAVFSGAKVLIATKAVGLSSEGLVVERGTKKEIIRARVFIGADGVHSSVARFVGQPPLKSVVALQYEVVLPEPRHQVEVFFHKDYEGGYAWFFPKGRTANVGLGVVPRKTALLHDLLHRFLEHLADLRKIPAMDIVGKTGGSIPCEMVRRTVFGNTLLAGDAAGHAHPITGAGILNAVLGGEIAGRIAAAAVERDDLGILENFEEEWREAFGKPLAYAAFKRETLEKNWDQPDFEGLIRKTWIGFKEYHDGRKNLPFPPEAVKSFG